MQSRSSAAQMRRWECWPPLDKVVKSLQVARSVGIEAKVCAMLTEPVLQVARPACTAAAGGSAAEPA